LRRGHRVARGRSEILGVLHERLAVAHQPRLHGADLVVVSAHDGSPRSASSPRSWRNVAANGGSVNIERIRNAMTAATTMFSAAATASAVIQDAPDPSIQTMPAATRASQAVTIRIAATTP